MSNERLQAPVKYNYDAEDEAATAQVKRIETDRAALIECLTNSSQKLIKDFELHITRLDWSDAEQDGAKDNVPLTLRSMYPTNSYLARRKSTSEFFSYELGTGGRNTIRRLQTGEDAASSSHQRQPIVEDAEQL